MKPDELEKIPFNRPLRLYESERLLREVAVSGSQAGGGPFGKLCEEFLSRYYGSPTLLTSSATAALEMCALLLNVQPGDEVILPSFTFVSTATSFRLRGATLRFADVDASGNILPSEISRLLSEKTKAVVVVHYGGTSADMKAIEKTLSGHTCSLVEDAAQAIGARFQGRLLGTFGHLSCLSFHETKNIGCGEGGALLLNDRSLLARAKILRDKGTNREQLLEGLVDKYSWVDLGSSWTLSEFNAAYLLPQLHAINQIQARREQIWRLYWAGLNDELERLGARILRPTPSQQSNFHLFGIVFAREEQQKSLLRFLREVGISATFHYQPLHSSPFAQVEHIPPMETLPGVDCLATRLVRLPLFYDMTDAECARTTDAVKTWICSLENANHTSSLNDTP